MKTQVQTTLLTIGMLLSFTAANAQFDLKKLGDKVKNRVETKVTETVISKKDRIKTDQSNKINAAIPRTDDVIGKIGTYDYKKKYKPSAAALAADPKAADQTVPPGFTKSVSAIHAAYEHLDPAVFTYQPYYKYKELYYLNDKEHDYFHENQFYYLLMKLAALSPGDIYYAAFVGIETPDGKRYVTEDEFLRNAYTALFMADPTSAEGWDKFVMAIMFSNQFYESKIFYNVYDSNKGIVDEKTGNLLPTPSLTKYDAVQDSREEAALDLARSVISIDFIRNYINGLFTQIKAETNPLVKFKLYYQIDALMSRVLKKHKNYKESDAANRTLEGAYSVIDAQRMDIESDARMVSAKPVEVPKGVSVDATTSAKVNALAKEMHGENFVKTIFLGNKWKEFKENKYPYRVMHLSIPVAVIIKKNNKYLINYYDVAKSPHGGDWNLMVQMGATAKPVNYK